jgi:type I restriction enzyme S subunit
LVALLPKNPRLCDAKYLYHLLMARKDELLVPLMLGTANVSLKQRDIAGVEIPLPPLTEQRRTVARIEELADRIEKARGLRRQAMEEAEALVSSAGAGVFDSFTNTPRNPVETSCDVRGGIQKSSKRTPGANPRRYITVAHVQRNWIDTNDERYFEVSNAELERWRLHDGDVLVIEGNGSAEQIGRAALFRGEIEDCVHQNHVIRVRPDKARLLPEFLNAYFNSSAGRHEMLERSRTTSGLFNLSVGRGSTPGNRG